MKLASFRDSRGETRIGAAIKLDDCNVLVDLKRAFEAFLTDVEKEPRAEALAEFRISRDMRLSWKAATPL